MKKIKTSDIVGGAAMPIKKGTLDHLQSAYQECLIDIIQTFEAKNDTEAFPNYGTPIIMYGCRWTGLGVSQGVVVYGTEMFRCQAVNITLGVGQVVVGTITTTNYTAADADPVEFSDGALNNVLEIRQIVWSAGASGSGDFDLDDCLLWGRWQDVTYDAGYLTAASGTWTVGGSSDFNVRWKQEGRTVFIDYSITGSSISASTGTVTITMPFNATFLKDAHSVAFVKNLTAVYVASKVTALAGTNDIQISAQPTFSIGSLVVQGQIIVELDRF